MDPLTIADLIGDNTVVASGAVSLGICFGYCAQRSRFCLRSAVIESWRGVPGTKGAIWLLAFSTALLGAQLLIFLNLLDVASVRQLASTGTLSGAILGGTLFGIGMTLARGCASRLLVLSATGNLRALSAVLIITLVAHASYDGALAPLRRALAGLWLVEPGERNLANWLPDNAGLLLGLMLLGLMLLGLMLLVLACHLARHIGVSRRATACAIAIGSLVAVGWWFTGTMAANSFEIIPTESIGFTGPFANTLSAVIDVPAMDLDFDIGLVPGVFLGSLAAALLSREFRIQGFDGEVSPGRYVIGAALMGFGGMLAGGCAVGAGLTGSSVLALTALVTVLFMWLGGGLTDLLLERRPPACRIDVFPGTTPS